MPAFPTFNNGIISQMPYGETEMYPVTQSYMPCGVTYTQQWNGGSPQKQFVLHFDTISKTEIQALESFWASVGGQLGTFSMVDDNGVSHDTTRFDEPNLDFIYQQPGAYGVDVKLLALD